MYLLMVFGGMVLGRSLWLGDIVRVALVVL